MNTAMKHRPGIGEQQQRALADVWRRLQLIESWYHNMQPDSGSGRVGKA